MSEPLSNPEAAAHPVMLFDGVCNLCSGAVQSIIKRERRDAQHHFRFAALHSPAADALLRLVGIDPSTVPDSVIVIDEGRAYFRSAAILRIAKRLRFPWPLLQVCIIVPPFLRNWIYDIIARNRYRWFGQRETCMMPTPELQSRFLL